VIESSFDTMKLELVTNRRYCTRKGAKAAIFEWIEVFYKPSATPLDDRLGQPCGVREEVR
jgi:hypothetical protein